MFGFRFDLEAGVAEAGHGGVEVGGDDGEGTVGSSSGIRWICVPSRSSQVYLRSASGGSTRANPISSKKPAAASMLAGATSIPT